ncbi:MAG: capsular biosynthesis protein [Lachnospiraceae bacterium]|nr:capsular biosynthesis protein [Lachnospiraceae bacterium]
MINIKICDIHCHLLFGVDDGAKTMEQAGNMLEIAYEEGIRNIIITPHYNSRIWPVDESEIKRKYNELVRFARDYYPNLNIFLGREIYYCSDAMDALRDEQPITMAGGQYVLMEFDISIRYEQLTQAIMEIIQFGYIPIIAHVERYECIMKDYSRAFQLKELGAYIQVNVSGVMGHYGKGEKKCVKMLLKNRLVEFVATDAHRDDKRTPHIKKCVEYITKKYGMDYARRLFEINPSLVIENKNIEE